MNDCFEISSHAADDRRATAHREPIQASTFCHPDDVLSHPELTQAEKRAILASWASDARSVENAPDMRRLDSGALASIHDILQGLRALDAVGRVSGHRPRKETLVPKWLARSISRDDDDDPPPCPAGTAVPVRLAFLTAHGGQSGQASHPSMSRSLNSLLVPGPKGLPRSPGALAAA
jgi:hypothetical protein